MRRRPHRPGASEREDNRTPTASLFLCRHLVVELDDVATILRRVEGHARTGMLVEDARHHIRVVEAPHQLFAHGLDVLLNTVEHGAQVVGGIVQEAEQQLHLAVAGATARAIAFHKPEKVSLVAMGLEGKVKADEDEQCALYLRNLLQGRRPDKDSVRALILAGEESQKYDDPSLPQWPPEDRMMALDIDSHNFALRIAREDDLFVSRPEYV